MTGKNGILTKAENSKEETNRETAREKLHVVLIDIQIDKISKGEAIILNDDLAQLIESYADITSAKFTRDIIETVVDGYTFEVNGKLGIEDKKEIIKVEPENLNDWEYDLEEIPGYAVITKYKGEPKQELIIPNYINGVPVKKIQRGQPDKIDKDGKQQWFSNYNIFDNKLCEYEGVGTGAGYWKQLDITSIIISDGIEIIGEECFKDMPNLESVSIPKSVNEICSRAFECNLEKNVRDNFTLNIPRTVKIMEDNICGKNDILNIEYEQTEIPMEWMTYWLDWIKEVNYGVKM